MVISGAQCGGVCPVLSDSVRHGLVLLLHGPHGGGHYVGLDNYREVIAGESFRKAASNTLYFSMVSVPLLIVLSLGLALLLHRKLYFQKWLRTAYVLPLVVPVASIILVWQILFDWNGVLNAWLSGFGRTRVDWMKTEAARNVIMLMYVWKNIGYNVILFLAGLQQIPKDYYETAQIEGAGRLRQFRSITLVYLTSTMFLSSLCRSLIPSRSSGRRI